MLKTTKRERKKIRNNIARIIPFVVLFVFIYLFIVYQFKGSELKNNAIITTGVILKFKSDYRGEGGAFVYSFNINGKYYENQRAYPNIRSSDGYNLEGKIFPIVYDKNDPDNNRMLITDKDFKTYSIPFPDSLKWVEDYVR
ncbi:MAG TPA: hypothetical protein VFS25_04645 [Chitinophaga sp.]|jgi:hypothetical protein|uniref:hypothetical protein n=1 Tax=Chitinophaga sp. TaxID=1869181 RepID=UPI002DBB594A|nr:hypothetical protein [Chitinophaga sp.]HEU4552095.1 hypothetical protein [Chitinophaga sp.]